MNKFLEKVTVLFLLTYSLTACASKENADGLLIKSADREIQSLSSQVYFISGGKKYILANNLAAISAEDLPLQMPMNQKKISGAPGFYAVEKTLSPSDRPVVMNVKNGQYEMLLDEILIDLNTLDDAQAVAEDYGLTVQLTLSKLNRVVYEVSASRIPAMLHNLQGDSRIRKVVPSVSADRRVPM